MNVIGRTVFAADLNTFNDKEDSLFLYYAKKLFDTRMNYSSILFSSKLTCVSKYSIILIILACFPNVARWYSKLTGRTVGQNDIFQYFTTSLTDIMEQRLKDPDAPNVILFI